MIDVSDKEKNEIKKALIDAFESNGFEEVVVETGQGELYINPCAYTDNPKLEDIEYYLVDGISNNLGGSDLDKLCDRIEHIEDVLEEDERDIIKLQEFFDKHLATKNFDNLPLGNDISISVFRNYYDSKSGFDIYETFENNIDSISKDFGVSKEECREAFNLAEDFGFYSDWYKDNYHFRPRDAQIRQEKDRFRSSLVRSEPYKKITVPKSDIKLNDDYNALIIKTTNGEFMLNEKDFIQSDNEWINPIEGDEIKTKNVDIYINIGDNDRAKLIEETLSNNTSDKLIERLRETSQNIESLSEENEEKVSADYECEPTD